MTGRLIRYWRERRGMSVTELATAAKLASQHISQLEGGAIATPSEARLLKIVEALGLTLPGFYGGQRELDPEPKAADG